jgi:antitoxin ParD1/3/4
VEVIMHEITISLSGPTKDYVDSEIASGRCASVSDVFAFLVEREQCRKARETIEKELVKSLDSGEPTEMSANDWSEIRAEVQRRHAQRNGGTA